MKIHQRLCTLILGLFAPIALAAACIDCRPLPTRPPTQLAPAKHAPAERVDASPAGTTPATPQAPVVSVLTYNVNYGGVARNAAADAIAAIDADVVLLQETNAAWETVLRVKLAGRYPTAFFHDAGAAGGMAIFSRYEASTREVLKGVDWFDATRVILETPVGRLQFLNVHLRPQVSDSGSVLSGVVTTPAIRRREVKHFYAHLDPLVPTVIAGDFNEEPWGRASEWLRGRGYVNAASGKDENVATWHWPSPVGEIRLRLDHILADWRLETSDYRVVAQEGSDHFPVMALVKLRRPN